MYTIRQASLRSGISVPLLRAWERRYGVVDPQRTASGYRLYDDKAVDRLRTMRRLVEAGWTPSNAAEAILTGDVGLEAATQAPSTTEATWPSLAVPGSTSQATDLVERIVDAAARFDLRTLEAALDDAYATGSFESATDGVILPALHAIGDGWAAGRIDVAAEHAASHVIGRRLSGALAAAGPAPARPAVIVGLPPGARHELGALAFAVAARRGGIPVAYIGADVPISSWVETTSRDDMRAAVLAVMRPADIEPGRAVRDALASSRPGLIIAIGGPDAGALDDGAIILLPAGLELAVARLREALLRTAA
jgi:DNA-binding transcriptional MerR regulator